MAPNLGNVVAFKRSSFEVENLKYTDMLIPHTATFYKFRGQNTTTNEETIVWCLKSEFDKLHGPIQGLARPSLIAEFYLTLRTAYPANGDIGRLNTEPYEDAEYNITIDNTWYNVSQNVAGGVPVFAIASPKTPSVMFIGRFWGLTGTLQGPAAQAISKF
ncbi:MAG: hypothetical protein M1836_004957 [Candelina mexicana]|nr:MAG: hypothetical protein M1836_004957 [Candelina mexicana]